MLAFLGSMAGRIFFILVIGVALSATLATVLADARRRADVERAHLELAADRVHDFAAMLGDGRPSSFGPGSIVNIEVAIPKSLEGPRTYDPVLTKLVEERLPRSEARAEKADLAACRFIAVNPAVVARRMTARRCWIVSFVAGGETVRLAVDWPPRPVGGARVLDPLFLAVLLIAAAGLALLIAWMAAAPVNRLAKAASDLATDLDHPALTESGPSEVAAASRAFNAMQVQLKRDLDQRRHMLAAITHDLQTPLTRLRLRLEKVKDAELRERLVVDIRAMSQLVQEGLALARSTERTEAESILDLDSLLASMVEDEADAGRPVTYLGGPASDVRVRPIALRRALTNLIDNAVFHGGGGEVAVEGSVITIRDHGPGIPEARLAEVFEPFVRLEDSRSRDTGGVGLGLTIARTLVEQSGGTLLLRNHPAGGLEAVVSFQTRP